MAFIKGNSSASTQATEVLADIESLCLANGWTKLGVWNEPGGVFDWHWFESGELSNGDRDFTVGIRIQTNGAGHLVFVVAEEVDWQNGTMRIHAPSDWTGTYKVKRPSDGGVFEAVHSSDYGDELISPIFHSVVGYNGNWTSGHIPPYGRQCNIEDAALVQWMLKVEPDGIIITTYRTQANSFGSAFVQMGTSLLPFAPNPIAISHLNVNSAYTQITGTLTRMPVNPDFVPYMDPDPAGNTSFDFSHSFWFHGTYGPGTTTAVSAIVGQALNDGMTPWWIGPTGSALFILNRRNSMRIFDPDTGDLLSSGSMISYGLYGWLPYHAFFNTDSAINIGDEVQGPGSVRYVYSGINSFWIEK